MSAEETPEVGSRGRTSRGAATEARLRTAAREVFADLGYASARVEDVTARAGVSHGTFYTYFDNKAAALDALVDHTATALLAVVDEPWEGPDVARTVEGVLARFVEVFADEADVIRAWIEASAHDPHFRERLTAVRRGYIDRVAEHLAPVTAGTPHDPQVAAGALVAMVEGYTTERFDDASEADRRQAVRTLAAIWFGGIQQLLAAAD